MKKRVSLKQQIFLIYIVTAVSIAGITSFYIYSKTKTHLRETLKNHYQNTTVLMAKDIEAELDTFRSYSFILSQNPSMLQMLLKPYDIYNMVVALNGDIEPTIQYVLDSNHSIDNIVIYTDESEKHIPSVYFQDVSEIANTEWYNAVKKQDGTMTFCNNDQLFIITPIRNYHSQKIDSGFIKLTVNLDNLTSKLLTDYENLQFILYDENKNILFDSLSDKKMENYVSLSEYTLQGTSVSAEFYLQKTLLKIPTSQLLAPVLLILVIFLLFSYCFIHYLHKQIFLRLENIAKHINEIDRQNIAINIVDDKSDEIGILISHINQMSQKINHLFTELSITKEHEKQTELKTLRAKIDPHFLYNIMDTINWIAMDGNTELVCTITSELGNYYRTSLNDGQPICTIENEIENIKAYLNLQQIATSQGFDVNYVIDERLLSYKTCDFILQPLVENAIVHGIRPLKTRRGIITISLYEQCNTIFLSVLDNGVGLQRSASDSSSAFKKIHYGIQNINERISLAFGKQYGVTLQSAPGEIGTLAYIRLPKQI